MKKSKILDIFMEIVFLVSACVSIIAVLLICVFLFANGVPAIGKIGVFKFLLGNVWQAMIYTEYFL